jgi:hypothetical protein
MPRSTSDGIIYQVLIHILDNIFHFYGIPLYHIYLKCAQRDPGMRERFPEETRQYCLKVWQEYAKNRALARTNTKNQVHFYIWLIRTYGLPSTRETGSCEELHGLVDIPFSDMDFFLSGLGEKTTAAAKKVLPEDFPTLFMNMLDRVLEQGHGATKDFDISVPVMCFLYALL